MQVAQAAIVMDLALAGLPLQIMLPQRQQHLTLSF